MKTRLRTIKLLICLLSLSYGLHIQAQEYIAVGEEEKESQYVNAPIVFNYQTSYTQTIYLASELEELSGKYVIKIAYHLMTNPSIRDINDPVRVYLAHTDKERFNSNSDWLPIEEFEQYFEGRIILPKEVPNWIEIELDKPFLYDGSSNLIIAVEKPELRGFYANALFYASIPSPSQNRVLTIASDTNPINILEPNGSMKNIKSEVPNTRFYLKNIVEGADIQLDIDEIDFDFAEVGGEHVSKTVKVTNLGKSDLIVTGFDNLNQPFSSSKHSFTISSLESEEVKFLFAPTSVGEFTQQISFIHNAENNPFVSLQGTGYANGSLLESFEKEIFPGDYWRIRTHQWTKGEVSYHGDHAVYLGNEPDTLITPLLSGEFSAFARHSASGGTLKLLTSSDLVNWNEQDEITLTEEYQKYTIQLNNPVYVGITGQNLWIDLVRADQVIYPEKDLLITGFSIPTEMKEKTVEEIKLTIKNWGKQAENDYKIVLKDGESGEVLLQQPGESISPLEEKDITLEWSPLPEVNSLYLEIELTGDEELTNNVTPKVEVSITPYLGNLTVSEEAINFGILKTSSDIREIVIRLTNIGIAPLILDEIEVNEPFTVEYSYNPINTNAYKDITVKFGPAESGVYEEKLVIKHDGIGGVTEIPLKGEVLVKGTLYEEFDEVEFPPFMWSMTGTGWSRHAGQQVYEGSGTGYLRSSLIEDLLITPKLTIKEGDELSFYARSYTATSLKDEYLKVLISKDKIEWETLLELTSEHLSRSIYQLYTIPLLYTGEYYIAFTGNKEILIDNIRGPIIIYPDHDINILDFTGPTEGTVNRESVYSVTLRNQGEYDEEEYTIQLLNGNDILLTMSGELIPSLVEKQVYIPWTPHYSGKYNLRVKVELEGDEEPNNNISEAINVKVDVENSKVLQIGTTARSHDYLPLTPRWNYSLSETIYYDDELNLEAGTLITRVGYFYYTDTNSIPEITTPIRLWVGFTDKENLGEDLVQVSDLTLVYNDNYAFSTNNSSSSPAIAWFDLEEPLIYTEGNLLMLIETNRIASGQGNLPNTLVFYETNSDKGVRSVYYRSDNAALDIEENLERSKLSATDFGRYPTTAFTIELPGTQVSGILVNKNNNPIPDAKVKLTSDNILYQSTTNEEGEFSLEAYSLNREYTFTIEKEEYQSYTRVLEVKEENIDLGTIVLKVPGELCNITVNVSMATGISPAGTSVILENNYSGLRYTKVLTDTGIVEFEVSEGTYTLKVEKDDLLPYVNENLEVNSDLVLDIELKENTVTPFGLQADVSYNEHTGKASVSFSWNNDLDAFFDDFESYDNFSLSFSPWTGNDVDRGTPIAMDITYENAMSPQYAIIFNPLYTSPARWGYPQFMPYSGYKYVVFTGNATIPNNDWLIAPKKLIKQGDVVSFMAKALGANFATEEFKVAVSEKGNTDINDFVFISSNGGEESVGSSWTKFQYDLSNYADKEVYVAINYTSRMKQMLMVDDFYLGQPTSVKQSVRPLRISSLTSYEVNAQDYPYYIVYKNGVEVTTTTEPYYLFEEVEGGEYEFGVQAVYQTGTTEMMTTNTVVEGEDAFSKITIHVTTNNQVEMVGIEISLSNSSEAVVYNRTIENGSAEVKFARKGEYSVWLEVEGYKEYSSTFTLESDYQLDIMLEEIIIKPSNLAVISQTQNNDKFDVLIQWNEELGWRDSFEDYKNFATDFAPWTALHLGEEAVCGLGLLTEEWGRVQIQHEKSQEASPLLFNPSATTPATNEFPITAAQHGDKYVAFFSPDYQRADDWLISPVQHIQEGYYLTFFMKAIPEIDIDAYDGYEEVYVCISEQNDPESFQEIALIRPSSKDWKLHQVDLSEYAGRSIYIGFHYVTYHGYIVQLDNVYVGADSGDILTGNPREYEIYLNGDLQGTSSEHSYLFTQLLPETTYRAGVKASYVSGDSELVELEFTTPKVDALENHRMNNITIYPTLVNNGFVWIESDELIQDIRLFNMEGQLLFLQKGEGDSNVKLDVSGLAIGVYTIKVTALTNQRTVRISITH